MTTGIVEVVIGKLAGAVLGKLGGMAVEQVANQASLLLHFKKDFQWLENELSKVRGYLQYEHDQNEPVMKWFGDVKDIALDAEDVVEECALQHLYGNSFMFRQKMGRRIRKLKERMESIMKDLADLNLVQQVCQVPQPLISYGRAEEWKKSGLVERDARPVAMDAKVEKILHFLEDDAVQVIAVVGMGGIGKTFLLQHVYNHHKVQQRFQNAIWLSISQVYSVAKLQYDIISHLDLDVKACAVSEQRAAELIHKMLRTKSSLLVLDDVWSAEGVNNLIQRLGIPGGTSNNPCKVVVTTRSMEVCNIMGASQIYHMELLSEQDGWNLFCFHAFPDDQQNRSPQELDGVARQVERECGRLPLAIKTVAASMASQKLLSTWESKLRQLKEVSDPDDPIRPILGLSYDALPAMLKPCFLYFSFFGEDVEIDAEYLIYLWMGEGFIRKGKEQWSTGWNYLKHLNNLCLVEVREDEMKKTCKIHDLLLDLAISISKNNKCAFTVEEALAVGCRRILLAKKGLDDVSITGFKCPRFVRTLSLSQNYIHELPTKSLKGVQALRVIDLSDTSISLLPISIGNLKLLTVLNLSNTRLRDKYFTFKGTWSKNIENSTYNGTGFKKMPDCIRNLKSLCFLNVDTCPLPEWIGDLTCLQHLHVGRVDYSREISGGLSKLVYLRILRTRYKLCVVLKDVAKLIHLEELRIDIANEEEQRSLEEGVLAKLVNMRRLTINNPTNLSHFPEKMKAMKDLEYLLLCGLRVPRWICEYGNLRVLRLRICHLSQYPALQTMPNLMCLKLIGVSHCEELPESFGKSGAFPQLRSLEIRYFPKLEKWPELQHGAMPRLEVFQMSWWQNIPEGFEHMRIPKGFEHLRSLKLLDLKDNNLTNEERRSLSRGGAYWNKIKVNNPDVTIVI